MRRLAAVPRSLLEREHAAVIVPVFTAPVTVDASNAAGFAQDVSEFLSRHGAMVIDCSQVSWIATSAMRFLAAASRDREITLVHPSPAVHLMAATHGVDVSLAAGHAASPDSEAVWHAPRLVSRDTQGKAAS
jgi:anti-anti-sigma regulatory factor